MTWQLKYTITNKLLLTIREIGESIGEIKAQKLTHTVWPNWGSVLESYRLKTLWASDSVTSLMLWTALLGSIVVTALIGWALFYVLVVPTTMPGAFFWKNKGFEQHARDIGLADMPQVGVAPLH